MSSAGADLASVREAITRARLALKEWDDLLELAKAHPECESSVVRLISAKSPLDSSGKSLRESVQRQLEELIAIEQVMVTGGDDV